MKKLKLLAYVILFILAAAAAGIIIRINGGLPGISMPRIMNTKTVSASESILSKTLPLKNLALTGMTVKVVFPHDLYPAEYNWKGLLEKRFRSEREEELYTLYNAAKDLNMDLAKPVRDFIVLTFDIECGISLDAQSISYRILPAGDQNEQKKIILTITPPVIQSIIHRDMASADYAYPGLEVSPGGMSRIISVSERFARKTAIASGIIEATSRRGSDLLSSYFTAMGFAEAEIIFSDALEE